MMEVEDIGDSESQNFLKLNEIMVKYCVKLNTLYK